MPVDTEKYDKLISAFIEMYPYFNKESYIHYYDFLFGSIPFEGKKVLDIGGGMGFASFYSHCNGASKVVCLEPEAADSFGKMNETFQKIKDQLEAHNVELLPQTFQEFDNAGEKFDIFILNDSLNHLDEEACLKLRYDAESRKVYLELFKKLHDMANKGAFVVFDDVMPYNIFPLLGLKNPKVKTIEWHKHQLPSLWCKLFEQAGFSKRKVD